MDGQLTARELEVLRLVAKGMKTKEIASVLKLSLKTIEHMLGSSDPSRALYPKIGVSNRIEAAAWYVTRFGAPDGTAKRQNLSDQLISVLSDYSQRTYQVRLSGQPLLAIEMATFLSVQAHQGAKDAFAPGQKHQFLNICANALIEQGTAYLETTLPCYVLEKVRPVVASLRTIAKDSHSTNLQGVAYVILAGAYNIAKQYSKGRQLYTEAFNALDTIDLKLRSLRGKVIASTYLADREHILALSEEAKRLFDISESSSMERVCETMEGVARAKGLMKQPDYEFWFEEANRILSAIHNPPLRSLQLIVSRLEVIQQLEPTAVGQIENLGREGIYLAQRYKYQRHEKIIHNILKMSLGG